MGRKIDFDNISVETELIIWEYGLSANIESIIGNYIDDGNDILCIDELSTYIAACLKEEQSDREIFNIVTRIET